MPKLRAIFLEIFGHHTASNNGAWLRRKLCEQPDATRGRGRSASIRRRDAGAAIWTTGAVKNITQVRASCPPKAAGPSIGLCACTALHVRSLPMVQLQIESHTPDKPSLFTRSSIYASSIIKYSPALASMLGGLPVAVRMPKLFSGVFGMDIPGRKLCKSPLLPQIKEILPGCCVGFQTLQQIS